MKRISTFLCAAALMFVGSMISGQQLSAQDCGCAEPVCGCEAGCDCEPDCGCESSCCECEPDCGCESSCCETFSCDGGCDSMGCGCGGGKCPLGLDGDPFALFGSVEDALGVTIGGWVQTGYHSRGSNARFNSRPGDFQLHQAWLYAEKAIDTSDGFDIGGRIDYIYGTDSQDTQSFGLDNGHWDTGWDNGNDYGHALPQAYVEMGYGDLSVKIGHFYTIIGWEVVTAPDNFFYSHAYTMYNSEPFTHTGALATLNVSDDVSVFGGYTFGWDSGFADNGDNFIGGFSAALTDDVSLIYATVAGRFNEGTSLERGYMHSIVLDVALSENLQYIFQSDLLESEDATGATARSTFGINNYWIYTVNDHLALGTRFEWWENNGDVFDLTLGANISPQANLVIRPEIRWDWDEDGVGVNENGDDQQTTFGIDAIVTF